jgi:hypothetical protein
MRVVEDQKGVKPLQRPEQAGNARRLLRDFSFGNSLTIEPEKLS